MSGPFAMVPAEVLATGNGYAIAVYAAIAQHGNKDGEAHPSIARLQEITGWSRPTIDKAIRTLCEAGVLVKTNRAVNGMKRSNAYALPLDARSKKSPNGQIETTLPTMVTTFETDGNDVTVGTKRGYHEQEVNEPEEITPPTPSNVVRVEAPAKPLPRNGIEQSIVAAFCEAAGIARPVNFGKAIGHAKLLAKAGISPDDMPDIVRWLRGQKWLKDGFDLGTVVTQADKWLEQRNGRKPSGPPGVELLPGESAEETEPGCWTLTGTDGRKRYVDPRYYGIVFDTRIHTHEGRAAFEAAVAKARSDHERPAA